MLNTLLKLEIKNAIRRLLSIHFTDYIHAKKPEVSNVSFNLNFNLNLKNKSSLLLSLGQKDNKYYLKASSVVSEIPSQIKLTTNDGKEKLEAVERMIKARTRSASFNALHGAWVYSISKQVYEGYQYQLKSYLK